jgi:hypothetical protein
MTAKRFFSAPGLVKRTVLGLELNLGDLAAGAVEFDHALFGIDPPNSFATCFR